MTGQRPLAAAFFDRFAAERFFIAHRGFRACYPENTSCAFVASLGRCAMIELDVRLSGDHEVVVFHDPTLERTSDGAIVAPTLALTSLALEDWTLAQLRGLDLGSWFLAVDPFQTIRNGEVDRGALQSLMPQRIVTLREVLAWAQANRMPLNIELKVDRPGQGRPLVAAVVREIRAAGAARQVLVSSFDHEALRQCHRTAPEIALAALAEGAHPPDLVASLRALSVCAYHPAEDLADPALIRTLRGAGLHVNVFTVNDPARQRQLFAAGVTGIFTDYPRRLC